MGVTQNPQGWTDVTPAADTKIAYVDATDGNDGTAVFYDYDDPAIGADPYNPVGPINAYQTIDAAIVATRDTMADWVLLKRGETWVNERVNLWGNKRTGRSPQEPLYIGAYGDLATARPLILSEDLDGINGYGCDGNLIIQSLNFYAHKRDPLNPSYDAAAAEVTGCMLNRAQNETVLRDYVLIEDCKFSFYAQGINLQVLITVDVTPPSPTNNFVRRCTVNNSYNPSTHSQGMYITDVDDCLVEECMFDRNGWYGTQESHRSNSPIPGAGADGFSHNIYWTTFCPDRGPNTRDNRPYMTFRDNYTMNASGAGIQLRAGGTLTGCVSYMDPYPFLNGHPSSSYDSDWPSGVYGKFDNNYSEACNDMNDVAPGGIPFRVRNSIVMSVIGNLCKSPINTISNPARLGVSKNDNPHPTTIQTIHGNVFNDSTKGAPSIESDGVDGQYDNVTSNDWWDAASVPYQIVGNNEAGEGVAYLDDTRTLAKYATDVIGLADLDAFWVARREMRRGTWDTAYMTPAVLEWLKTGYDMTEGRVPAPPSNLQVTVA